MLKCQGSAETLSGICRSRNVKHQPRSYIWVVAPFRFRTPDPLIIRQWVWTVAVGVRTADKRRGGTLFWVGMHAGAGSDDSG